MGSEAEDGPEGLTNTVSEEGGHIKKKFDNFNLQSLMFSAYGTLASKSLKLFHGRRRIDNEKKARKSLEETEVRYPEILDHQNDELTVEKVEGDTLLVHLSSNPEDAYGSGRRLGEVVSRIHRSGISLLDCSLGNFMVSKDNGLWAIDMEFSIQDSSAQFVDRIRLLSSIKRLDGRVSAEFIEGFEEGYDFGLKPWERAIGTVFSTYEKGIKDRIISRI